MFATTFATAPHAALLINGLSNSLINRVETASLKVGETVLIQSGNEGDSYWTPKAQMVVLEVEEGKFGMTIATGVCKRDDGTLSLKLQCAQYGVGELFYATRALFDYQMMRYLSASDYNKYTRLMSEFSDEIEHLEAYTEIHKDYSKKEVTMNAFTIPEAVLAEVEAMPVVVTARNRPITLTTKDSDVFAGELYYAQLGNESDSSGYVENAQILILSSRGSAMGQQFTAVSKMENGQPQFLFNVSKYRVINYKLYCTRALDMGQLDQYLDVHHAAEVKRFFAQHKEAFEALVAC